MGASHQQHPRNLRPRLPEMWRCLSATSSIELFIIDVQFWNYTFQDALSQLSTREHSGTSNGVGGHTVKKPELSPKPRDVSPKPEVWNTWIAVTNNSDHPCFKFSFFQGQPVRKPPRQLDGYVGFANLPNQVIIPSSSCFEQGTNGWNVAEWCIEVIRGGWHSVIGAPSNLPIELQLKPLSIIFDVTRCTESLWREALSSHLWLWERLGSGRAHSLTRCKLDFSPPWMLIPS